MLYIFQKGLVSTNVQHVMFTSFELFDIFPVSLYLLSLICKLLILWVSWIHLMKRIGCTSDDGSQFCVYPVSLPLAPVMYNPCHQQLTSVTRVWRLMCGDGYLGTTRRPTSSWQDPLPHHENLIMLAICVAAFQDWRRGTYSVWACSLYLSEIKCYWKYMHRNTQIKKTRSNFKKIVKKLFLDLMSFMFSYCRGLCNWDRSHWIFCWSGILRRISPEKVLH